jgi:hypothetical protein
MAWCLIEHKGDLAFCTYLSKLHEVVMQTDAFHEALKVITSTRWGRQFESYSVISELIFSRNSQTDILKANRMGIVLLEKLLVAQLVMESVSTRVRHWTLCK